MEQKDIMQLDEGIKKDYKECKEKAEILEKFLTMLVKGFAPEY